MITDIPHKLWLYLGSKNTSTLPPNILRNYYLSWEDALWDVLRIKKIPKGALCLVPEFFCWDVVENMKSHGLKIKTYSVNENLQPGTKNFITQVNTTQPQIIIIFHAVGIKNHLVSTIKQWNNETIIIEDCVHRLINPSEVKIRHKNHLIIDSWRKVIPLQGASLYMHKYFGAYRQPNFFSSFFYQAKIIIFWFLMEFFSLINLDRTAQTYMQRGYDIIGDNLISAPLLPLFSYLHNYINYKKVRTIKYNNMRLYDSFFKVYRMDKNIFIPIKFTKKDWANMRGYPIGINLTYADKIVKTLRSEGLLVRFELNDSPWSTKQKIIYLPSNPEVSVGEVKNILRSFSTFLVKTKKKLR